MKHVNRILECLRINMSKQVLMAVLGCFLLFPVIECFQQCCDSDGGIQSIDSCRDGKNLTITCDGYRMTLNNDWSSTYYRYMLVNTSEESYLDAYVAGYTIKEPNFCIGNMTSRYSNKTSEVAIVCSSLRSWYHQIETDPKPTGYGIEFLDIFVFLVKLLNLSSFILLLLCAFIYGSLPELQDIQGTSYFHFTLNAAFGHAVLTYFLIFNTSSILPDLCITNMYLELYLVLSCFTWAFILAFHTWRQTRSTRITDEAKLLQIYRVVGYGTPAILLFLGFIHVHVLHLSDDTVFVLQCYKHQQTVILLYGGIPIMLSQLANLFFFIDCQRLLWNALAIDPTVDQRSLKILKYRCLMNAKLFFMMGLPWLLSILLYTITSFVYYTFIDIFYFIDVLAIASEGILISLILVVSRKRVLRGIANKWFVNSNVFPSKWKTMKDSETQQETENGDNEPNDFRVHYNAAGKNETVENGVTNINKDFVTDIIDQV